MKVVERSGRTVAEAVAEALQELGVPAERAAVEVLDEGTKGLFGLIGARLARVRVTVRDDLQERISAAQTFLEAVLREFGVEAAVEGSLESDGIVRFRIAKRGGRGLGVVIGRRGQTLDALQYLTNLVANKIGGERARIILDAEGYRERRAEALQKLACRLAERVKRDGRKAALEPMNALERRIVHLALQNDAGVETYSEGEEPYRRVIIAPKRRQ